MIQGLRDCLTNFLIMSDNHRGHNGLSTLRAKPALTLFSTGCRLQEAVQNGTVEPAGPSPSSVRRAPASPQTGHDILALRVMKMPRGRVSLGTTRDSLAH